MGFLHTGISQVIKVSFNVLVIIGPEKLLRLSSTSSADGRSELYYDALGGDPADAREWKCVRTINGMSFFGFYDLLSFEMY